MAEIETPRQSESINSWYEEINKYFLGSTLEELSHTQNNQIKNTLDKVINNIGFTIITLIIHCNK